MHDRRVILGNAREREREGVTVHKSHQYFIKISTDGRHKSRRPASSLLPCSFIDHASDGDTPDSTALCELTRGFHPVISSSCVAEVSRSGEGFQACLDCG